jgi:hypothetical protein
VLELEVTAADAEVDEFKMLVIKADERGET